MVYFFEPEKIIENLDLQEDFTVADFGAGAGGFTIPLAKKLKRGGFVYALDIQEDLLSALLGNARIFGLNNIRTIKCDLEEPEGSTLPENSLEDGMLIIKGKRKRPQDTDKIKKYLYQECFWGKFEKKLILPKEVDITKTKATIKNGILTLKIPKLKEKKKKEIKVESKEEEE